MLGNTPTLIKYAKKVSIFAKIFVKTVGKEEENDFDGCYSEKLVYIKSSTQVVGYYYNVEL